MSFWKMIYLRWDAGELRKWTTMKRTAYLLVPLLIYFVAHDAAEILLVLILGSLLGAGTGGAEFTAVFVTNQGTLQAVLGALAALLGTAAIWPALKRELEAGGKGAGPAAPEKSCFGRRQGSASGGGISEGRVTAYAFLAALAFCLSAGLNIVLYQTGFLESSEAFAQVQERQYGVPFAVGLVLYGGISPLAEEAVFRGLLYNRMKRCFGYGLALAVSSFLFGAYHGNLVQTLYGCVMGLVIAYTYELYGSFAAPMFFHGIANVSVYAMTCHGVLETLGRGTAMALGVVMLLCAAGIFWYIRKRVI